MAARRWLPAAVAIVLTLGLSVLALRSLDFGDVADALRDAELWWLVPSLGALMLAFWLRVVRWQLLFGPETRPSVRDTAVAYTLCLFFNSVLPLRAGEVVRVLVLHQRTGVSRMHVLGTVAAERIYDVLALLALLALSVPWLPDVPWLRGVAVAGGALAVVVALASAALVIWGERVARVVVWPLRFFPSFDGDRREAAGRSLLDGIGALHRPRAAAVAAVMTGLSWLALWLAYWLLLEGFAIGVGATAALLVLVATGFSLAVPSGPSAVGVFEAAVIVALLPFDVTAEAALSYGLVLHALNLVPYVLAGIAVLALTRGSIVARHGRA